MKVGIIGLPNVGKSTLFNGLTKKQVDAENYPFCTIDPNIGVVEVPDERLEKLAKISQSKKIVPAVIEFVDIAGLVKNAHKGEGLGNQFLSHIREVDAIIEVLRDFEDKNITHVEGNIDPDRDKSIIHLELVMADLQAVEKKIEKISKETKTGDKQAIKKSEILEKLKKILDDEKLANQSNFEDKEKLLIKDLNLLTLKPIIFVLNIKNNSSCHFEQSEKSLKCDITTDKGSLGKLGMTKTLIQIDAKHESELAELSDKELKELGVQRTGLDKLISASYNILNLITYLTTGPQETHAWTVEHGTKAPQAAAKIHTDFEKGFIRAEVCKYNDFISAGSELKAKEKGLVRLEGKDYIVQDGDVVYFRISS